MKFRAKMAEPLNMRHLATIGSTLSKLSRTYCLQIGTSVMNFLISEENSSPKQTIIWCTISSLQFFNEYNIEGLTEKNEIYLEVPADMFSSSLSVLKQGNNNVKSVKIKLTSKHSPCLSIEMELLSEFSASKTCLHDIPVNVILPDDWKEYSDPPTFSYSISLEINNVKKLRNVVERLKKLCNHLKVIGTQEGCLEVWAEAETAVVKTMFRNNDVSRFTSGSKEAVSVKVDAKRLNLLLCTEQINPRKTQCDFVDEKLLHFQLSQEIFVFNFFIVGIVD